MENQQFTLCGKQCCPTITFQSDNMIIIKDDYSGQVRLTMEEFMKMLDIFQKHNMGNLDDETFTI